MSALGIFKLCSLMCGKSLLSFSDVRVGGTIPVTAGEAVVLQEDDDDVVSDTGFLVGSTQLSMIVVVDARDAAGRTQLPTICLLGVWGPMLHASDFALALVAPGAGEGMAVILVTTGSLEAGLPLDFGAAVVLQAFCTPFPLSLAFLIAGPSVANADPDCLMRPACWLGPPHSQCFRGVDGARPSRKQAYAALA